MATSQQEETEGTPVADAITEEEIEGTAPKKNAFSELMSPKKSNALSSSSTRGTTNRILSSADQRNLNVTYGRDALAAYTASPTSFPPTRVLSHNDNVVVINDLYPKSSIHLLLLPRNLSKQLQHPFNAFDGSDPQFLALVKAETAVLREQAASELRRRYGKFSASDAARNAALDDPSIEDDALPPGRDWSKSVISGIHAGPSMNHLHIHVLSVDRHSECMKDRKHYNSFATPFLVPVEDFPLAPDDPRRHPGRQGYLDWDMKCWRCGKNFRNKFAALKRHLAEEFEAWKRE